MPRVVVVDIGSPPFGVSLRNAGLLSSGGSGQFGRFRPREGNLWPRGKRLPRVVDMDMDSPPFGATTDCRGDRSSAREAAAAPAPFLAAGKAGAARDGGGHGLTSFGAITQEQPARGQRGILRPRTGHLPPRGSRPPRVVVVDMESPPFSSSGAGTPVGASVRKLAAAVREVLSARDLLAAGAGGGHGVTSLRMGWRRGTRGTGRCRQRGRLWPRGARLPRTVVVDMESPPRDCDGGKHGMKSAEFSARICGRGGRPPGAGVVNMQSAGSEPVGPAIDRGGVPCSWRRRSAWLGAGPICVRCCTG